MQYAVQCPRVWWWVKVYNAKKETTTIRRFNCRFYALQYAFRMSQYRKFKVYCYRCGHVEVM